MRARPKRSLGLLGTASLVLGIAGHSCRAEVPNQQGSAFRSHLAAALSPRRLAVGRLRGLTFAPTRARPLVSGKVYQAVAAEIQHGGSAQALADRAVLDLAGNRLDQAISRLEKAHRAAPADAGIASDLAATLLERGLRQALARDLVLALESAEAAVALDRTLPEAWFNVALAREHLFLTRLSVAAWDAYLALDPSSGWANEARSHRARLAVEAPWDPWWRARSGLESLGATTSRSDVRRIVSEFPQAVRQYAETELMGRWSAAEIREDHPNAAAALAAARTVGTALAEHGDWMLCDSVAVIDRAAANRNALVTLARGHDLYARGARLYAAFHSEEAAVDFAAAERYLAHGGSPFRGWAVLWRAACDYQASRYPRALARLAADLPAGAASARYPSLAGRANWIRGLIAAVEAQPAGAVKCDLAALASFRSSGEIESAAVVESLLADAYGALGDEGAAWSYLYGALAARGRIADARGRQGILDLAADATRRAGAPRAALRFAGEALQAAQTTGSATPIALALRQLAVLQASIERWSAAERAISEARVVALEGGNESVLADVLLAEAEVFGGRHRDLAIARLSAALPILERTHYDLRVAGLFATRGRMYAAAGRVAQAEADIEAGIRRLERTAGSLEPLQRAAYLDRSSELFATKIELAALPGEPACAATFRELERAHGHAAVAWQARPSGTSPARDRGAATGPLPPGAVLVEYLVLPEHLIAWVLHGSSVRCVRAPLEERDLGHLVAALRMAVEDRADLRAPAEKLYERLVAPLALPPGASPLVIVPDKILHEVPFGALRDPATGRYLAEDFPIELAPSAGDYLRGATLRRGMRGAPSLLAVGDPAFDRQLVGRLARLPAAAAEAAAVAALYPASTSDLLTGSDATKQRVLDGLARHSVIHLAVHAEADLRSPLLSRLFFAPASSDPGVLFAHELYGRRFSHAELVVLAGCNTAARGVSPSNGAMSLAMPFLAGGATAVVGSLWKVDDRAASALSMALHRRFAATRNAPRSLQDAQLQLMRSPDPMLRLPAVWAAFVLTGGAGVPEPPAGPVPPPRPAVGGKKPRTVRLEPR